LGESPASKFYVPTFQNTLSVGGGLMLTPAMKMEQTECSEMTAHKIRMPGNHPKERVQHPENGESLKSRKSLTLVCHFLLSQTLV
jgi:hypothetical protein